jgi:hypothetical protein
MACAVTLLLAGTTARANTINLVQNGNFSVNDGAYQLDYNHGGAGPVESVAHWSNPGAQNKGYNFLFLAGSQNIASYGTTSTSSRGVAGSLSLYTVTGSPSGGNFIGLDADYETGPVQQTITGLKVGQTYDLTFDWAAAQQTGFFAPPLPQIITEQLIASLGGAYSNGHFTGGQTQSTPVYILPGEIKNGPTIQNFSGWMPDSMVFTATSNSEVLSFLASGSPQVPPFTLLANVSLTATPEPGTLPLLLTGLLVGAGLFKYRGSLRRSQQSL